MARQGAPHVRRTGAAGADRSSRSAARTRARSTSGARWRTRPSRSVRTVSSMTSYSRAQAAHAVRCSATAAASSGGSSPSTYALRRSRVAAQFISARLPGADPERLLQPLPRAGQARHDRADGRAGHLRDLLVRQSLDLPQHDRLPVFALEPAEGDTKLRAVGRLERVRVGGALTAHRRRLAVLLVHVLDGLPPWPRAAPPRVAAVAHDGQQPRARVAAAKAGVVAPRAQVRV